MGEGPGGEGGGAGVDQTAALTVRGNATSSPCDSVFLLLLASTTPPLASLGLLPRDSLTAVTVTVTVSAMSRPSQCFLLIIGEVLLVYPHLDNTTQHKTTQDRAGKQTTGHMPYASMLVDISTILHSTNRSCVQKSPHLLVEYVGRVAAPGEGSCA